MPGTNPNASNKSEIGKSEIGKSEIGKSEIGKSGPPGTNPARYSDQDTELLERLYREDVPLIDIAEQLDRTERSVRAKLSSLGLYKKQPYKNKNGEIPKKKEDYVSDIATLLGVDESLVESLDKCTKFTLKTLLTALTKE